MEHGNKTWAPRLALFSAALIWGSSFFMMKNTVAVFPPNLLLALRFALAGVALCLVFRQRLKAVDRDYLQKTALIGFLLYLAYGLQTLGVAETSPGKNAFLTAIYCVVVPFLHWAFGKHKPTWRNLLAAILCLCGIGLVSLTQELTIGAGDGFTLLGGLLFSCHMVCVAMFSQGKDPILITILQFGYCALLFGLTALMTENLPATVPPGTFATILYLTFFCTALALLLQSYGQKYTLPATASLILSLEAVFGVLFSVLFFDERLTLRLICGFTLIFAAILVSEANFGKKGGSPALPPDQGHS